MFNGGGEISCLPQPAHPIHADQHLPSSSKKQARINIVEQPISKRFRYESESRSAGSIVGVCSTPGNKTYPTISVEGYQGRAVVVVSCVTRDKPYRPHPHKLVSKENKECGKGIISCRVSINGPDTLISFKNIGIQCVTKRKMAKSLEQRELLNIDPFLTGFSHKNQLSSIDVTAVRLCFQVFLERDVPGKFSVKVPPVVSDAIYSRSDISDLRIIQLSDCTSYVDGGKKIIILCEKVVKGDIQVRFFEKNGDWEAYADLQPSQVHKQTAIWFITPPYKTTDITDVVKIFIQLRRPSDGKTSEPLPFELLPKNSEPGYLKRKRQKIKDADQFMNQLRRDLAGNNHFATAMGAVEVDTSETQLRYTESFGAGIGASDYELVPPQYSSNSLPYRQSQGNTNVPAHDNVLDRLNSLPYPQSQVPLLPSMGPWNIPSCNSLQGNDELFNFDSEAILNRLATIEPQSSLPNLDTLSISDELVNCPISQQFFDSIFL